MSPSYPNTRRHGASGSRRFTANLVTGARFVLAAAVGGAPRSPTGRAGCSACCVTVALLTDLVDGRLARATGTTSELGARLDQEADAFLILVLSAVVAADLGWWVLGIGLARYVFGALFALVPPLRTPPAAPRFWCKMVAALVGVVLAAAAVLPLPDLVATVAVGGGRRCCWPSRSCTRRWTAGGRRGRRWSVPYGTVLAFLVVWLALVAPTDRDHLTVQALLRLPLEVLVVVGARAGAVAAAAGRAGRRGPGCCSALLLLVKVLDLAFNAVFDRDFDPVGDWAYLGPGVGVLGDSIGVGWARAVAVLAGLATLGGAGRRAAGGGAAGPGRRRPPPVLADRGDGVRDRLGALLRDRRPGGGGRTGRLDQRRHADRRRGAAGPGRPGRPARVLARDRGRRRTPSADPTAGLLAGLRGKDVLLVFVESYGRVAVQDTSYSAGDQRRSSTAAPSELRGGRLPLAERLPDLTDVRRRQLAGPRQRCSPGCGSTASGATGSCSARTGSRSPACSGEAGWRTVFDVPANTEDWPEGEDFYGFDALLRLPQRRLRGAGVRLRADARPVHARRLPPPRARARPTGRR